MRLGTSALQEMRNRTGILKRHPRAMFHVPVCDRAASCAFPGRWSRPAKRNLREHGSVA